jgi:hypothetical protein
MCNDAIHPVGVHVGIDPFRRSQQISLEGLKGLCLPECEERAQAGLAGGYIDAAIRIPWLVRVQLPKDLVRQ